MRCDSLKELITAQFTDHESKTDLESKTPDVYKRPG